MSANLPKTDSMIGITVDQGRYEIVKLIGEGGMGKVFQARQLSMNRMVALKILRANMAADEQLLARFQQEALSVSRLRHPNTITIYDYGRTEDGQLFMAMELLGGESLFSHIHDSKGMALGRALHIMEQVVGAVGEAHKLGIVHRDLKPENIQIDEVAGDPDFAKVLDFGIAKIMHGESDGETRQKTLTMAGAALMLAELALILAGSDAVIDDSKTGADGLKPLTFILLGSGLGLSVVGIGLETSSLGYLSDAVREHNAGLASPSAGPRVGIGLRGDF